MIRKSLEEGGVGIADAGLKGDEFGGEGWRGGFAGDGAMLVSSWSCMLG